MTDAEMEAFVDLAEATHRDADKLQPFRDLLLYRLGTAGYLYEIRGYDDLLRERDCLLEAMEKQNRAMKQEIREMLG